MRLRRPPLIASLLTVLALMILCALGTWQLQRLTWKADILRAIDSAWETAPAPADSAMLAALESSGAPMLFTRVTIDGDYDTAQSWLVGPRTRDGRSGYHLFTPLYLRDGGVVLVNRGWVEDAPAARGVVPVRAEGFLRRPETPNRFVPPNDPARDIWHSVDIAAIAAAKALPAPASLILYATADDVAAPHPRPAPNNNHRDYAFFWFAMAAVLAIMFALRFLRT